MPSLQTVLKAPFRLARSAWRALHPPPPPAAPRARRAPVAPPAAPPMPPLTIVVEETPNPEARKFVCGVPVVAKGSLVAPDAAAARGQPLAEALFALDGVASVFATHDFVTVTRAVGGPPWPTLEDHVVAALQRVVPR